MALSPIPFRTVLTDLKTLLLRNEWVRWLQSVKDAIDGSPQRVGALTQPGSLQAALPATTIATVTSTGLYRLNYYSLIEQAATVSSSLTFTIRWTDGGVAYSFTNTTLTNAAAGTTQTVLRPLHVDTGTNVTIEAAYASVGATPMQYQVRAWLEQIG